MERSLGWSEALPAYDTAYLGLRGTFDWDQLVEFTTQVLFEAGDVVLERGETDRALYLVTDGTLEVLTPRGDGGFDRLTTVGPGGAVGEIAFLDGAPRTAAIRALTAGEMRRLTLRDFEALARVIPDLAQRVVFEVARILARRLRLTDEMLGHYRDQRIVEQRVSEEVQGAPGTMP